jgi:hypothetical protein
MKQKLAMLALPALALACLLSVVDRTYAQMRSYSSGRRNLRQPARRSDYLLPYPAP